MKKLFAIIIGVLMSFAVLAGCKAEPEYRLTKTKTTYEKTGRVTETEYIYGDNSYLTETRTYSDGELNSTQLFGYDEYGNLNYNKIGEITEIFYKNDEQGRPTEKRYVTTVGDAVSEKIWTVEYTDEYGSYVETSEDDGTTQSKTYDSKGNLTESINGASHRTIYDNTYDEEGKLIKTVMIVNSVKQTTEYEYGDHGKVTKESTYGDDSILITVTEYFYSSGAEK